MKPDKKRPFSEITNPSDDVVHTYGMGETRDHLRRGESYKPGYTMAWFDESGKSRYLRIDVVYDDDQTLAVTISHPNFNTPFFDTQISKDTAENRRLSMSKVDKFCRGSRADLGILLNEVYNELDQMTVFVPTGAIDQAIKTGNWSQVPQTKDQILREALQAGTINFYYQDPPNYQQLFDALGSVVQFVNKRVADRFGLKFTEIKSLSDVTRLLEQICGTKNVIPTDNITDLDLVINKYANRLNICSRAALALFQCWLKENPQTWQDQRVIDE